MRKMTMRAMGLVSILGSWEVFGESICLTLITPADLVSFSYVFRVISFLLCVSFGMTLLEEAGRSNP